MVNLQGTRNVIRAAKDNHVKGLGDENIRIPTIPVGTTAEVLNRWVAKSFWSNWVTVQSPKRLRTPIERWRKRERERDMHLYASSSSLPVYTSSLNVTYESGRAIVDGREDSLPCPLLSRQTDHYGRTKQLAEELVLAAAAAGAGTGGDSSSLRTCALRPGFVYGPHERNHLPRMVQWVRGARPCLRAGFALSALHDMVHVDNAAGAHAQAVHRLEEEEEKCKRRISGQAYNVTDGNPDNIFLFFMRRLVPAICGEDAPILSMEVPVLLVQAAAWILTLVAWIVGRRFRMPTLGAATNEIEKVEALLTPFLHACPLKNRNIFFLLGALCNKIVLKVTAK